MNLLNVEVSYRTAGPDVLVELPRTIDTSGAGVVDGAPVTATPEEFFALVTCHRAELYAVVGDGDDQHEARSLFRRMTGIRPSVTETSAVVRRGPDAAEHLFRVAAGLESLAVGEEQILGQIRDAFGTAERAGTVGVRLRRLFDHAVHAARRARRAAATQGWGLSLLDHGLDQARRGLDGLSGRCAMVIGPGAVGSEAVRALRTADVAELLVSGRTGRATERFASEHAGVRPVPPELVGSRLGTVDLVVTASSSPAPVLDVGTVAASRVGVEAPLVLLDLARPRDVDPACGSLAGVRLVDLASLGELAAASPDPALLDDATEVLRQELAGYLAPTTGGLVRSMRSSANLCIEAELARLGRRLPDADDHVRGEARAAMHRMINSFLHAPLVRAEAMARQDRGPHLDALTELFSDPGAVRSRSW